MVRGHASSQSERARLVFAQLAGWTADGAVTTTNLDAAIAASKDWIAETDDARNAIILFGGGQIYEMALSPRRRPRVNLIFG